MSKLHKDEIDISEEKVYSLLKEQKPEWAECSIQRIESSGSDNALFRLGDDFLMRMPRIEWAVSSILKEAEWVPKIASNISIPISESVFTGLPSKLYPWHWLILPWYEGQNPEFEKADELGKLAGDLANFCNQIHALSLPRGPLSRRGIALNEIDIQTRQSLSMLGDEVDVARVERLWKSFCALPTWAHAPVWLHGDLHQGNMVTQNGRLAAVIDFSDVGIGDPACDYIAAWSLFGPQSRATFKRNIALLDENTWQRGRGWALSIALIMLPYYRDTHPPYASLARRIILEVCKEGG